MERKSPNLDVLVTKDIKLEDINQAFTDLSTTGNQDLRIRINFPAWGTTSVKINFLRSVLQNQVALMIMMVRNENYDAVDVDVDLDLDGNFDDNELTNVWD